MIHSCGYRAAMRTHSLRSLLLPLAVAPLLLAGCSSDESESSASAGSSSAESSAESSSESSAGSGAEEQSSADAEKQETFCTEVPVLLTDITDDLQAVSTDPTQAQALISEAVDRISAVEPPADAAPAWDRLVAAWTGMRDLLAQADLTDPQANADLAPQLQTLQTELVDSGSAVDEYGQANC